ncbi:FAD-binding domain-containing protein [Macrolepiota fuliginosa MF-IS2]|uniref:FAD-binding domain-containing protein n=1 Tax=Macrolepiota fuliginosa MF-IS2 TaxID=1400762 RepID=A0A9P6C819_9AGAR|nr:FAD-binding domain-containing protein [Macrolepiota fuliginosa MF-IS2]
MFSWLVGALFLGSSAQLDVLTEAQSPLELRNPSVSAKDWQQLGSDVGGRMFEGVPFAEPCFTGPWNSSECVSIRENYVDEVTRTSEASAYIQTQWETCQVTGEQCLLNFLDPNDTQPTLAPRSCKQGSVPSYFIDVRGADDVNAAFKFVKGNGVPLVIKNTGHDYKGRSSAPGSLALWMHNLKNISYSPAFVPSGCTSEPRQAATLGAGVQWGEAYAFADTQNITLVGGSDKVVGAAGGWLQGGGQGALSPSLGLGADRALEFKIVTPDGKLRIANECQNTDLFWALRGGGGGTFGVVLESTVLASPQVKLQTLILTFAPDANVTKEMWTIMADNGLKWAEEGWGGFSMANVVIFLNPKLSPSAAQVSMAPLIDFGKRLQATASATTTVLFTEFPSWNAFFQAFSKDFVATVGSSLALASRLIPKSIFETTEKKESLVSGLLAADAAAPGLIILISAPTAYTHTPNATSVTDAWRSSVYHVTVVSSWNWNATLAEKQLHYQTASGSIDNLRRITPDAAYQNEADVHEPNHEVSFWGTNYPELLRIKQKYDPDHLLDCWHCVGWNQEDRRFSCYV